MKATSWPRGTKTATDHLAGRSNCCAFKLTARHESEAASQRAATRSPLRCNEKCMERSQTAFRAVAARDQRAPLCDATKKIFFSELHFGIADLSEAKSCMTLVMLTN